MSTGSQDEPTLEELAVGTPFEGLLDGNDIKDSTNSTDTQGFLENLTRDVVGENGLTVFDLAELRDAIDRRTQARQTEAYKKGYAAGGVDEILRHENAKKAVIEELKREDKQV